VFRKREAEGADTLLFDAARDEREATMKPLVIYHANCWDGFCAAWIADRALGGTESFAAHYGTPPPEVSGRELYIVDFSYPREVMRRILSSAAKVVVLDHHKTAEAELAGIVDEFIRRPDLIHSPLNAEMPMVWFDMEKSGGRLAWEHFHVSQDGLMCVPASPWLVDYTEDRDLWRHKLEDSEAINAALRSYPLSFDLWDGFAKQHPTDFTREGEAIRRREKQIVRDHVHNAREIEMAGHRILAVNATVMFSEIAGELAEGRAFGACYFERQDGKRVWSLRSRKEGVDVSEIAKSHGGGGHKQAAGFEESLRT
jgi:oligoribonuclease NrnB/cAMP/cGMP phosphodiesterase (DHH superfamily)